MELLSPAGDLERCKFALLYGADAIYASGKKFSLRANATNFTDEELEKCSKLVHSFGKKLYVPVNIIFHDKEAEDDLLSYLKFLEKIGVDAVIVSDPIVWETINEHNIKLDIHISTQASTLNSRACKFYEKIGATRVVLARETTKEDIAIIKNNTSLELEVFISGAMCTSFSGRCVLSNYLTNRDSNRGGCVQACRFSYDCPQLNNKFEINSKDLNMVPYIKDLNDLGVASLKIEGRMRSIYYIATILSTYKSLIKKIETKSLNDEYISYCEEMINRASNRESIVQYFNANRSESTQYYTNGLREEANQDFLGLVLNYENKHIIVEVRNYFKIGDVVQIFDYENNNYEFKIDKLYDEDDNEITVANKPKTIVKIPFNKKIIKNSMIRKKVFDILN